MPKNESIFPQKIGSWDFWLIANSVLNKGQAALSPLNNGLHIVTASDQAKFFVENVSKNLSFDDSNISLPTFPLELI